MSINQINKWEWAISIVENAKENKTLKYHSCAACAVGNLIAAKQQYSIKPNSNTADFDWLGRLGRKPKPNLWWQTLVGYREKIAGVEKQTSIDEYQQWFNTVYNLPFSLSEIDEIEKKFENEIYEDFIDWMKQKQIQEN